MSPRILLVSPPEPRGRVRAEVIPDYSLGYLATALRQAGHEVGIQDLRVDPEPPEAFARRVCGAGIDLIGFHAFSISLGSIATYARAAKRIAPQIALVAGGPHPIFEPADTLERVPELDYACSGEGEECLPSLAATLGATGNGARLEPVPNLVWREHGAIRVNPGRFLADLDRVPMPAWDLMGLDRFPFAPHGIFTRSRRVAPIITSRGCPYSCTYCGAQKASGKKIRRRSPSAVLAEIEHLKGRFGIEEVHVEDSNFEVDAEAAKELCRELIRARLGIRWARPVGVRLDALDRELVELMERSGCYSVAAAIESGSQRVLDELLRKNASLGTIREKLDLIRRSTRIRVTGLFILGTPSLFDRPAETAAEIAQTVRFALEAKIDRASFFVYTPYPGTERYEMLKREAKAASLDLASLDMHYVGLGRDEAERAALRRTLRRAYLRFYLRPRILLGLAGEIRSLAQVRTVLRRALGYFRTEPLPARPA